MFPNLTAHEKDLLLAHIRHHMDMELRYKIMRELPQAYNHYMDQHVVSVIRDSDKQEI